MTKPKMDIKEFRRLARYYDAIPPLLYYVIKHTRTDLEAKRALDDYDRIRTEKVPSKKTPKKKKD